MHGTSTFAWSPRDTTLLAWCVAGSIAAHVLLLTVLPGMQKEKEPPMPLMVELLKPPEIEPPKLLPVEKKPPPPEPEKTKPAPLKPVPREERPTETPRQILTAPPDAPPAPAAPVVPVVAEQKPAPPPETPRAPQPPPAPPVVVTQPAFNAAYLNNPKPDYPQMAFRRGETGTVYVLVLVTKEGRAGRVSVHKSSGSPALDTAATRAITGWRFEPGRKGSEPVESEVIVPMPFTLKEAP